VLGCLALPAVKVGKVPRPRSAQEVVLENAGHSGLQDRVSGTFAVVDELDSLASVTLISALLRTLIFALAIMQGQRSPVYAETLVDQDHAPALSSSATTCTGARRPRR